VLTSVVLRGLLLEQQVGALKCCCGVEQCVAVCCSSLQCIDVGGVVWVADAAADGCVAVLLYCRAVCYSLLQCVDGGAAWVADEAAGGCVAVF